MCFAFHSPIWQSLIFFLAKHARRRVHSAEALPATRRQLARIAATALPRARAAAPQEARPRPATRRGPQAGGGAHTAREGPRHRVREEPRRGQHCARVHARGTRCATIQHFF